MKSKTEVQQVVERYINSKNAKFVNDYIKMMEWLIENEIDDVVRTEAQITVVNHFLHILDKNKLRLVDVCATRNKKTSAEVLALLDGWLKTNDDAYKQKALGLIAYQTDPITIAFLHGVVQWKSKLYEKQHKVEEFVIPSNDNNQLIAEVLDKYDKMFAEALSYEDTEKTLQTIALSYPTIAKPFADELNDDEEMKLKEKKSVYSKLQDHHRAKMYEYFKQLEDYDERNPRYTKYLTSLYSSFVTNAMQTVDDDELMELKHWYVTAIDFKWTLFLIDDESRLTFSQKIYDYKITQIPQKPTSNSSMEVAEDESEVLVYSYA